jgi:hypothetical protein
MGAAIRHMHQFDTGALRQQHHGQMTKAAASDRGTKTTLARLRPLALAVLVIGIGIVELLALII